MPFASAKQEFYMMKNHPDLWREWVDKYGHHPGFKSYLSKLRRRKKTTSKRKKSKRRTRNKRKK